jgi:hypothetical protein
LNNYGSLIFIFQFNNLLLSEALIAVGAMAANGSFLATNGS